MSPLQDYTTVLVAPAIGEAKTCQTAGGELRFIGAANGRVRIVPLGNHGTSLCILLSSLSSANGCQMVVSSANLRCTYAEGPLTTDSSLVG